MRGLKFQRGMSFYSTLVMVAALAFGAYTILIMVPVYLSYFTVRDSLDSLTQITGGEKVTAHGIESSLLKRFQVNAVAGVNDENINITQEGNQFVVTVDYEVRKNWVGNVDLAIHFSKTVKVGTP